MNEIDTPSISSQTSSSGSSRPKKFTCTFEGCDKAYSRPSLLEQHIRSHTNERPFRCSYQDCDKSFLRKSHLDAHVISHALEKPFSCSICGKGVNSQQHLRRHEITHSKSFTCTYEGCTEAFYKHQSLRHHILSVHEKTLTCTHCNKSFQRPFKLAQHNLKHHGDSPAYQCDHSGCFSNFKTWSALQFHVKQEHPKLKCSICGKGCVGRKGLRSHMLSHDEQKMVKLWQCNYCDIGKFPRKADLVNHYNEFHDGNIPENLLKRGELERLEQLLNNDESNRENSKDFKRYRVVSSDEDSEDDGDVPIDTRSDTNMSQRSMNSLNDDLGRGKSSIIDLIQSNFSTKKLKCPKGSCGRLFSREHDLNRHLKWHEENLNKIEAFLEDLRNEETEELDQEPPLKKSKQNPSNIHTVELIDDYEIENDGLNREELQLVAELKDD
ncbi:Transcription factor IIIA [Spathaspora sp. JA1]|nr:Transcription factor IIIA [Spathaspora sp. JA1]